MRQVVHSTILSFEEYLDNLVACAANLGIPLSRPSTAVATPDKRNTIRTESSATLDTNPTRSASAGSSELVNTPLTSPSFKDFHLDFPAKILTRKLSKAPTFSQYEDYLANLDPHYKQSALKTIHIGPHSTPSLLSSETRKSLFSLRHGLSKIRPRRKSRQPPNLPFMFVFKSLRHYIYIRYSIETNDRVGAAVPVEKTLPLIFLSQNYHVVISTVPGACAS